MCKVIKTRLWEKSKSLTAMAQDESFQLLVKDTNVLQEWRGSRRLELRLSRLRCSQNHAKT